jgi:hypothetical protein
MVSSNPKPRVFAEQTTLFVDAQLVDAFIVLLTFYEAFRQ